ncbi:enoyl-CoA hydratase [Lentibacillus salinarum]|uniref:Enoyl-CoA hydratase n=1 Tax=Lentibacillus salinarum TaxID=446820 RepID=A0ABW3ZUX5_9BACI
MRTLSYETKKHVAVLTIQSPPTNALSSHLLNDLNELLDQIETDSSVKAVVLTGEGKFFSAGADIKELTSLQDTSAYQSLSEKGQRIFDRIEHFPIPVIAAIHGAALGGGLELAMACHIRVVTEDAKLGLPEVTLGIIPGFAGTQRLPQYVGTAKAYEMILSGEPISGEQAKVFGLANHSVQSGNAYDKAFELAEIIASRGKLSINAIMDLIPYAKSEQFAKGVQEEAKAFAGIFGSADAKEGLKAFIEKRKPNFQDK